MMRRAQQLVYGAALAIFAVFGFAFTAPAAPVGASSHCDYTVLTFPTWHNGLTNRDCEVEFDELNDLWRIALNIVEILIQLAGYAAVVLIVWGGIKFVLSQGSPDKISDARTTIMNAVIGLVVALAAVAIVRFVSGLF